MKTELDKLKETGKNENPFHLPDNYFAQFNEEIMNRLPEKEPVLISPVSLWDRVKPWVYLAAMFVGLYFTIQVMTKDMGSDKLADNRNAAQTSESVSGGTENYWSEMQITEEEFYEYLEEQLIDDTYFEYMYYEYQLN